MIKHEIQKKMIY